MSIISFIKDEIKDQYLQDKRPWIIGFSGGKDSTALLQLVWYALRELPKSKLKKEIHVVCNDTLVENPKVVEWIDNNLELIAKQAKLEKLPFIVAKTVPELEDSFWVNLIGKGYPTPNNTFRWCTQRLKINPTTKYIREQVAKKGEVIILLGTREDESAARKKSVQKFQINNNRLRRHLELDLAFIYTPINRLSTNELWQYLLQAPAPWNGSNRGLVTLYKNGTGEDCPLVIDTTTASCGQSRFGCWVCTVVKKDKSLEAMIDNGEEQYLPLLELRDWLYENRDKDEFRQMTRRNKQEGKGPYNIETRGLILNMLLNAQKAIGERLISSQELKAIQVIWQMDGFGQNAYEIYYQIYNDQTQFAMNKKDDIKQQQADALSEICKRNGIKVETMLNLVRNEKDKRLMRKRVPLQKIIEETIAKESAA